MSFFYLFLGASHFSLIVYIFAVFCYNLGIRTRKYILSKLSIRNPELITVVTTMNTVVQPPSTTNFRVPREIVHPNNNNHTESESSDEPDNDDTDDDYDSDDDIDIVNREIVYDETDKIDGKYYIGIAYLDKPYGIYLMNGTISTRSFFEFPYNRIATYTRSISVYYVRPNAKLDILKLHIHPNGVYEVTIQTFWIRIIQRAWRNTYAHRIHQIRLRGNIRNQEYFRNTGRYTHGSRVLPSIHGILCGK